MQKQLELVTNQNEILVNRNELLEMQISNLENTLSDTISFFSVTFGLIGLGVAILLVIAGWIMNKIFNNKLQSVNQLSEEIKTKKDDIDSTVRNIEKVKDSNDELNRSLKYSEKKYTQIEEIQKYLINSNEVQEVYSIVSTEVQIGLYCIFEIENSLPFISEEMIEASEFKKGPGEIKSDFQYSLDEYKEQKEGLLNLMKTSFDIYDYIEEKENDKDIKGPKDSSYYTEIQGYVHTINEFHKKVNVVLELKTLENKY